MRIQLRKGLVVAVASTALLAGCAGTEPGTDEPGGDAPAETITYWARGANLEINEKLVEAYNASHETQVQLLGVSDDDYPTKLATAVASGAPPDVATVDIGELDDIIGGEQLTDIRELAEGLDYFDQLRPAFVDRATVGEALYALPENVDASTMFWNKDLFRAAGLDPEKPPTTFEEIMEYSRAITALGDDTYGFYYAGQCNGCLTYSFSPLVWASGGDYSSADGSSSTMTDPAMEAAVGLYADLWDEGLVEPGAQADTGANWLGAFASGKIGMVPLGAFAIGPLRADYPDVDFGVAALPGVDGGVSSDIGGDVIGIPAGSAHPDEAWDFIEWSLSEEAQLDVYAANGALVARSDLIDNEHSSGDANLLAQNEAVDIGRLPTRYANNHRQILRSSTGPWFLAIRAAIFEGVPVHEALEQGDADAQALIDRP